MTSKKQAGQRVVLTSDNVLKAKRNLKKISSTNTAIKLMTFVKANYPEDNMMIKKMGRQIKCSSRLEVYSNDIVKTIFCKEKTCSVCNSIRLAKFLNDTLDKLSKENNLYHMVLTVKNPDENELKETTDKMYSFFRNSSIRKNKIFRELNKKIKIVRSFETTFNEIMNTYHLHFHILLANENEKEIKEYGELVIEYWKKYFGNKANRKAQYLEPQEKSLLENFKYLFKIKDVKDTKTGMVYHLLKATHGKRLFLAKNIYSNKSLKKEMNKSKFNDVSNEKLMCTFNYLKDANNWINDKTGELFVKESDFEELKKERVEKRNYGEISFFLKNVNLNKSKKH